MTEEPTWIVVRYLVMQLHKTEQAAIDSAQLQAEQGMRVIVARPLFDVRPSSVVVACA